ncbi:response regulator [Rhizobium leguminosarum]|uniref:response regulator n=1 Tax=Rhizobium leguminosarum TaxID=384 RepID=UPI0013D90FFB|nr:response regulator [Rhizobium leguminosarum]NEK38646.1 response regulator [Rhizobium leguminosarum]
MAGKKILIVEDDVLIAAGLEDIVTTLGYDISGIADSFETAQQLAPFSTIALVDVNLKDGATGPRIGQYLASDFGVAVVMVTGSPELIETDLSKVIGLISKPAHPNLIRDVLEYLRTIREGERGVPPGGMRLFV